MVAVVDDDPDVRLAIVRLLSSAGFLTASYASGSEFVQCMDQQAPGCVVLDLHMPGMSGLEVQERLIKRCPDMPVLVVTGRDTAEARRRAMSLGARAYFAKPVDGEALLHAIADALGW
jgi:FixJ family two-component response regulator